MSIVRVLVSDKLSEAGLSVLRNAADVELEYRPGMSEDELCAVIGDFDGLIIRSATQVTARVVEAADRLRVVGRAGIGVDNVDIPAASRRGIVVMNTPTGNSVTTAEHALALLASLARKIPQAVASMRSGKWEKSKFQGREIAYKTLGIIGLGNIGRIVADRAQGLKMKVIGVDPVMSSDRAAELGIELVELDDLLERADFLTIHAPLTPETKNMINDAAFNKMKNGALIVNAARGGIVDEEALVRAIEEGKIAGAALDVFGQEPIDPEHPLLGLDNVLCTPHLGASTSEAQERVAVEIAEQAVAYLQLGIVKNAVNVPTLPAGNGGATRTVPRGREGPWPHRRPARASRCARASRDLHRGGRRARRDPDCARRIGRLPRVSPRRAREPNQRTVRGTGARHPAGRGQGSQRHVLGCGSRDRDWRKGKPQRNRRPRAQW